MRLGPFLSRVAGEDEAKRSTVNSGTWPVMERRRLSVFLFGLFGSRFLLRLGLGVVVIMIVRVVMVSVVMPMVMVSMIVIVAGVIVLVVLNHGLQFLAAHGFVCNLRLGNEEIDNLLLKHGPAQFDEGIGVLAVVVKNLLFLAGELAGTGH